MNLDVQVVASTEEFQALEVPWAELCRSGDISSICCSWEWNFCWWQCYRLRLHAAKLFIVLFRHRNELVGILPAYITCTPFGWRTLRLLGDPFETSLYSDILVAPGHRADVLCGMSTILNDHQIDDFVCSSILAASHCQAFAERHTSWTRPQAECPYISLPSDFASYLKERRRNMQKDRRRLFGELGAKCVDLSLRGRQALELLFQLHEDNFRNRGKKTRFTSSDRLSFHARILETLAPTQRAYVLGIERDDRLIGISYGFRCGERSIGYQLGYDPEYRRNGIGFQLILNEVDWAISLGLVEHDLSAGNASYKFAFCSQSRHVFRTSIALSRRARITQFFARQGALVWGARRWLSMQRSTGAAAPAAQP
jgi:CelD/BcsL family acetyltransferase involved in cellulose biosynthesis